MKSVSLKCLCCLLLLIGLNAAVALAQTRSIGEGEFAAKTDLPAEKKPWQLKINKDAGSLVTFNAQEVLLSELAIELAEQLGVEVRLSPVMQKQKVTAEMKDVSVETLLRSLAPLVYVDESITLPTESEPQLLGLYLSGLNEDPPSRTSNLKPHSETVLFMGNLDDNDTETTAKENPLYVKVENGRLTVRVQHQPISLVLYEIAQQLGVSFELQNETEKIIGLDLQDSLLEDVLRQLEAPTKLIRRRNLSHNESQPLRIILLPSNTTVPFQ